jgi:hypothetical protein
MDNKLFPESERLRKLLKKIKVGDTRLFKKEGALFRTRGEIREIFIHEELCYIRLYLFFWRKEELFILNGRARLVKADELHERDINYPVYYKDIHEGTAEPKHFWETIKRVMGALILITFILTINPNIKIPTESSQLSYDEFLKKNYNIYELYNAVTSRIKYRYDVGENWYTPKYAWDQRSGDCEEFANIIADHLTRHGIESYVVGLQFKYMPSGHAVVIAKIKDSYYFIDPTFASEPLGIKEYKNAKTLAEVTRKYSSSPASIYKIPSINGEKIMIRTVF